MTRTDEAAISCLPLLTALPSSLYRYRLQEQLEAPMAELYAMKEKLLLAGIVVCPTLEELYAALNSAKARGTRRTSSPAFGDRASRERRGKSRD